MSSANTIKNPQNDKHGPSKYRYFKAIRNVHEHDLRHL